MDAATSPCNRRRMIRRARAQLADVIPVLPARDVTDAVHFYVDRLGFELVFPDIDDGPQYAGIRRGAVELHLQFQFERNFEAGTAGQCMLRLVVDHPEPLFEEYKDKGVFHDGTQLDWWDVADGVGWDGVPPVDLAEGGQLDAVEGAPRSSPGDQLVSYRPMINSTMAS
jgi:catechol 2,3-dioxygenase-like lactoylglutathione lyase family enzyme